MDSGITHFGLKTCNGTFLLPVLLEEREGTAGGLCTPAQG